MEAAAAAVGVGWFNPLRILKNECKDRLSSIGILNGTEMCSWNANEVENAVKSFIQAKIIM